MLEEQKDLSSSSAPQDRATSGLSPQTTTSTVVSDSSEDGGDSGLLDCPVVAVGASAGGIEAYVELLTGTPANTGMAFVFIPHLSADHKSHLVEILARHTSMPVNQIVDAEVCKPNHVYVLPPNVRATISQGQLKLEQRPDSERIPRPIDYFFRSLAYDQKNQAIGVVLSGADADGSLGLKAIKGEGGITIAQTPDSARFSEMPRSGILVDHVDLILPPGRMGTELAEIGKQFRAPKLRPLEEGQLPQDEEQQFAKLLSMLRGVSGLDFRNYKQTTLQRRLARRMMLKHIDSLGDYLRYVQGRPDELRELQEDALINVTRFFRDPEVFEALKTEVFPQLFPNKHASEQIRIWCAGCSTGEEAYSLAIVLLEYFANQPVEPSIQIFGTDASENSIERARTAIYPESIMAEVSTERLRRYFVKTTGGFQVSKRVRDLCIFARQNLCTDPPFSRLSLVSCRNVLIYLNAHVQDNIIATFNYALKPGAFLMLGASESLGDHTGLFTPYDRKHKFYVKTSQGTRVPLSFLPNSHQLSQYVSPLVSPSFPVADGWGELELQRATDRIVLARHAPPGVVINEKWDILQVRGQVSPYLRMAAGTASLNLHRMINEGIAHTVHEAVERAMKHELPVQVEGARLEEEGWIQDVTVEVLPIQGIGTRPRCYLVLFLPTPASPVSKQLPPVAEPETVPVAGISRERQREVEQLRQDLSSSRAYLQSLIEERDARNQELTSAYEEVQSANEELLSTNEELETAKEELQSTNEELQTVNDELRDRNAALLQASNDLANLFNSINIPVVILGIDLTIRHFTPPTARMMHLRETDIGRPISEIRLNLKLDAIEPLLQEVLDTLGTKEVEVQDRSDRWHILRIRPYRTTENRIEGLVLVLVEVDQIRRSEEAMREARDFAQTILECVQVPLVVLEEDLRIVKVNAAFCSLANTKAEDLEHRSFPELSLMLWGLNLRSFLDRGKAGGDDPTEVELEGNQGRAFCFDLQIVKDGRRMLLLTIEDITRRKEMEKVLTREQERLRGEVEMTTQALGRTREELSALTASLFASQEEERRRVARELHDDISQKLALLEIQSDELRKSLPTELDEIKIKMKDWSNRLGKLSEDVRLLSHGLHPSMLDDLGLTPALRHMVGEFGQREEMPATFEAVGIVDQLSREASTALYRITQEALRNVAKHAGKTHVRVTLMGIEHAVRLTIRDLGHGFDIGEQSRAGLGLLSMEERARLAGGTLRVKSELNAGTTVEVEVPLSQE
jgi:two-component system, chemotaxis family, CheB/CheR fusion protein